MKNDRILIGLTVIFFVIGDLVTTLYALSLYSGSIVETNIVGKLLIIELGMYSLIPVKLLIFGLFYVGYKKIVKPYNHGIMIGLSLLGFVVTIHNILIIAKM